ncbi:dihydrolipoamide acetyltransferase family protein [Amphritea balenae]|uniref:Dihydrolipoamide acetyltransferase component of pyruvate dehydrogenase complex n=1 Tax=Amphritea balenae TaxID=452629 RepID=A0A3P1SLD2_9GAMM|nr:dihydrolipoamide acetyltransferase family protein [Amphritea balenae]RRC97938.1 2-oxo acid dehydrogenase subunit E2 [Amphritea balenae]GGK81940.1 acetyltransferase component of pyruvate dehydrogenase complex [Amphritea balenae]
MSELTMPSFGADMDSGLLQEWLVKQGDPVSKGDIVAVIETHKGAIDMEVFQSGTVRALLVEPGTRVKVGMPIADIDDGASAPASGASASEPAPQHTSDKTAVSTPALQRSQDRVKASPLARRLAENAAIPLQDLQGSGPDGAIIAVDVNAAIAGSDPGAAVPKPPDRSAMRQAIDAAMTRSNREIPHYYLATTIDLQAASQWLAAFNLEQEPDQQLLITVLLHKAVAVALRDNPEFNGFYIENHFQPSPDIHLATAISLRGGGLITPAIRYADQLTLPEMMDKMRDLTLRVRRGGLRSSEMSDAGITVSGMGERGVETVFGVIYPPQVAIIGLGKPELRPWVIDNTVQARLLVNISLAADHRVSDGRQGAKLLRSINKLLQQPECL